MFAGFTETMGEVRSDIEAVLSVYPNEVPGVLQALKAGKINGRVYCDDCQFGCLVGTIAIQRGLNYHLDNLDGCDGLSSSPVEAVNRYAPGLVTMEEPDLRPAELWFQHIKLGDTPQTNPYSRRAVQWIEAWLAAQVVEPIRVEEPELVGV